MAQIYSTAQHTVIHLGPLGEPHETVLKAVCSNTSGVVNQALTSSELVNVAENSILKLPWFTRVWVFQELVLSRDPWVQCGSLRGRWTHLCGLLLTSDRRGISKELKVLADMDFSRQTSRSRMFSLLTSRRGLGATDARDMIFAHMGIASDLDALRGYIEINYRKSIAAVYEDTARYLFETVGPETFFPHADTRDQRSRREDLASWAPDWSILSANLVPMYKDNNMRSLGLDAKAQYVFLGEPLILAYVGYEVDVVSSFSLELPDPAVLNAASREMYQRSVRDLLAIYRSGSGIWWSGDENGQYRHVNLRGKEIDHERLCRSLADEWLHIVSEELLLSYPSLPAEELKNHKQFLSKFKTWLESRAHRGIIMVGSDSDGMESLMYHYLEPQSSKNVLARRRFAITETGRVSIVPKQTQIGDMLVYLAGSPISLVLRRDFVTRSQDLDSEIKEAFKEKNEFTSGTAHRLSCQLDDLLIQKCTMVGECYVDGEVGWRVQEDRERSYTVYALR
jgi:hypothetical protein